MADLFYIIGASGVGKDSLLRFARKRMPRDAPVTFAHRYITRPADAGGENHVALSESEFLCRARMGCFAMHWLSHDTWYGIGIEINEWLAKGLNVVINGSRVYLNQAAKKYTELNPVLICAHKDKLRERLLARGRENAAKIEDRLTATQSLDAQVDHPRLIRINNNAELADAGTKLVQLIMGDTVRACD